MARTSFANGVGAALGRMEPLQRLQQQDARRCGTPNSSASSADGPRLNGFVAGAAGAAVADGGGVAGGLETGTEAAVAALLAILLQPFVQSVRHQVLLPCLR